MVDSVRWLNRTLVKCCFSLIGDDGSPCSMTSESTASGSSGRMPKSGSPSFSSRIAPLTALRRHWSNWGSFRWHFSKLVAVSKTRYFNSNLTGSFYELNLRKSFPSMVCAPSVRNQIPTRQHASAFTLIMVKRRMVDPPKRSLPLRSCPLFRVGV